MRRAWLPGWQALLHVVDSCGGPPTSAKHGSASSPTKEPWRHRPTPASVEPMVDPTPTAACETTCPILVPRAESLPSTV